MTEHEYASMLAQYRGGYFNETTDAFGAVFDEPAEVFGLENVDVIAGPIEGGQLLYTTVGFGVNPPDFEYPPFELVAVTDALRDGVAETLFEIGFAARGADDPIAPYHKFRFEDESGGFFFLDGGVFGAGWNVQRLIAVPVTNDEYDRFIPRDSANDAVPQALEILGLRPEPAPLFAAPAAIASRWS